MLMPRIHVLFVIFSSSLYLAFLEGVTRRAGLTLLQVLLVNARRTYPFRSISRESWDSSIASLL